jgi:nucleotide-binding universal stress UspA family protein
MKRILLADDGSDHALYAVEQAAELAAKMDAELMAIAVWERGCLSAQDLDDFARSRNIDVVEAEAVLTRSASSVLDRCRAISDRWGVRNYRQQCLVADDVARGIVETAKDQAADLIVIGSGEHDHRLRLGSISQKLATHSPCSVLIARSRKHAQSG